MIRNRMSEIMGIKGLKISDVHRGTGIARTTLSLIYNNDSAGITFDVLDKLLMYFGVQPNDFFEFAPYEVKTTVIIDQVDHECASGSVEAGLISFSGIQMYTITMDFVFRKDMSAKKDVISFTGTFTDKERESDLPPLSLGIKSSIAFRMFKETNDKVTEVLKEANQIKDENLEFRLITNLVESRGILLQSFLDNF